MSKIAMKEHFVEFYSPGTLFAESTMKPISSWDVKKATKMASKVLERYDAVPYAFRFMTYGRGAKDLDSKVIKSSNLYYLGGKIETREEVFARNDPKEDILRSNMRINDIKRIIVNDNSWRYIGKLNDDDVVLKYIPLAKRKKINNGRTAKN